MTQLNQDKINKGENYSLMLFSPSEFSTPPQGSFQLAKRSMTSEGTMAQVGKTRWHWSEALVMPAHWPTKAAYWYLAEGVLTEDQETGAAGRGLRKEGIGCEGKGREGVKGDMVRTYTILPICVPWSKLRHSQVIYLPEQIEDGPVALSQAVARQAGSVAQGQREARRAIHAVHHLHDSGERNKDK